MHRQKTIFLMSTMNLQINLMFVQIILAITFAEARSGEGSKLLEKQFCGYQHADDYFRTAAEEKQTSIDEFPWVAALIYKFVGDGAKAILCSGTLINRRYVLTAAQCLTQTQLTTLDRVRLGDYNVKTESDCIKGDYQNKQCYNYTEFAIEEKLPHVNYSQKTGANDIALLRLDRTIEEYAENIRPICLPDSNTKLARVGDTLRVSGWGRKSYKGSPAIIKKKIFTTLITNQQCAKEFNTRSIYETEMCTIDRHNNTAFICQGDGGAPVMFVNKRNQWHIEGISVWGGACGSEKPEVHTNVLKYTGWIVENMRSWE